MIYQFVEHAIEVDLAHHVNLHVRSIVIVHVVHVIEMNIVVMKIMMANIVVNIDVVEKLKASFFHTSQLNKTNMRSGKLFN